MVIHASLLILATSEKRLQISYTTDNLDFVMLSEKVAHTKIV